MATTISVSEAAKLRKRWGNSPCDHPRELLVEYIDNFQSKTGEYVCPICGEFFDKEEKKNSKKKENQPHQTNSVL